MINQLIQFSNEEKPNLTTYVLEGNKKRGAVLILPGGGYRFTSPREAEPIALKFNAAGFHAFILHYSCAPKRYPTQTLEVRDSLKLIFEHSMEWNVDTNKIAICGFSAGGHLAASYGVYWNDFGAYKPSALILNYPVITSHEFAHRGSFNNLLGEDASSELLDQMSLEKHINEFTPPTFIWHTLDDSSVPVENTLLFAIGLRKKNIPFEMHIYPEGVHGISLATEETATCKEHMNAHVSTWINLCLEWLMLLFSKGEKNEKSGD